jgi:hypothetical protein
VVLDRLGVEGGERGLPRSSTFERWASEDRGALYVAGFAARSDHRPDPIDIPMSVRDPKDDYLVASTRATSADALVSVDRDLLDPSVEDLSICTPAAFLERLDGISATNSCFVA